MGKRIYATKKYSSIEKARDFLNKYSDEVKMESLTYVSENPSSWVLLYSVPDAFKPILNDMV